MTKNENTRPAGGTAERAAETAAFSGAAISCNHSNTAAAGRQRKVSDFLSHGRENAVPLRHLKKVMEADGRTVRLMIQQERLSGMPICADNLTGYHKITPKGKKVWEGLRLDLEAKFGNPYAATV